ncbi:MAG: hypothetical protein ACQESR_23570 [Planctomycetota bacterium]
MARPRESRQRCRGPRRWFHHGASRFPCRRGSIFQAVGFFQLESCPTQAVLPLVGLAAEKVIRDR